MKWYYSIIEIGWNDDMYVNYFLPWPLTVATCSYHQHSPATSHHLSQFIKPRLTSLNTHWLRFGFPFQCLDKKSLRSNVWNIHSVHASEYQSLKWNINLMRRSSAWKFQILQSFSPRKEWHFLYSPHIKGRLQWKFCLCVISRHTVCIRSSPGEISPQTFC